MFHRKWLVVCFAVLFVLAFGPGCPIGAAETVADSPATDKPAEPQDAGKAGQSKPVEGAKTDEIQALKNRIVELQNGGKLGFRKVVACSSVEGFGVYSPVAPAQSLSKVVFYYEPSNVSTLVTGDRYIVDCSVDLSILDQSGKKLGGGENVARINRVSRSPILDLYFKIEIDLKKTSPGGVTVVTVLRDKIKNQSATTAAKIEGEGKGKKPAQDI